MTINPLRIAVVEDYQILREQLELHLRNEGHEVYSVDCAEDLDRILLDVPLDILILDLNLPQEDGNSIAQRVRKAFPHIGIIMHTVRVRISEKLEGYGNGADLYISKPASMKEINAAIMSLARRLSREVSQAYQLDIKGYLLTSAQGSSVTLNASDVLLLKQMAIAPNGVLEYDVLLTAMQPLHPDWDKENLEVHFSRLRKKLVPIVGSHPSIKALRGQGYQLCLQMQIKNA
jgi:DNA-binding response OmpR family regulator